MAAAAAAAVIHHSTQAKLVALPMDIVGGGERALLEAMACGAEVECGPRRRPSPVGASERLLGRMHQPTAGYAARRVDRYAMATAACAAVDALRSINKDNAKLIELGREAQGGVLTHRRVRADQQPAPRGGHQRG